MKRLVLIAALFAAAPALAQIDKASFDCTKAKSVVEKTICATGALASLDGLTGRYYDALLARLHRNDDEAGTRRVRARQAAWLKDRDAACRRASSDGGDRDKLIACLDRAYRTQILALAAQNDAVGKEAGKPGPGWSGDYKRVVQSRTDGGSLLLLHWPNGSFSAHIETVSGPTHHTCDLHLEEMALERGTIVGTKREDGQTCRVSIAVTGKSAAVTATQCGHYCGMRGTMDGTYRRP